MPHPDQFVVAHPVPGRAVLVFAELGAMPPGRAGGRIQANMGMDVDDSGCVDSTHMIDSQKVSAGAGKTGIRLAVSGTTDALHCLVNCEIIT